MLGGSKRVSATPAVPSYRKFVASPRLCLRVTDRQSEPPAGIERDAWLALVLTVKGLAGFALTAPKVVVHVVPALGIVAAKPAQLAVAETPAVTVTVSLVAGFPSFQYMVKAHTPAPTVCAGRLVNPQTVLTPAAVDRMTQGVGRIPIAWFIVLATHAGDVPLPCR
jgi:hypothetical protein